MTVCQDSVPTCVAGGDIPEQQRGKHKYSWGWIPAEGQLATAAGFAHILPKNKSWQSQEPQGCLWAL